MDINKVKPISEEQKTEYDYFCGGIQPIVIPEERDIEEEAE